MTKEGNVHHLDNNHSTGAITPTMMRREEIQINPEYN
jgi:hypothetical protein